MKTKPTLTLPTPDEVRDLFKHIALTQKYCYDLIVGKLPSDTLKHNMAASNLSVATLIKRIIEDEDKTENTD